MSETWTCHICKRERPDVLISVYSKPLVYNGRMFGDQNIRYCNDTPACFEGAKRFTFHTRDTRRDRHVVEEVNGKGYAARWCRRCVR